MKKVFFLPLLTLISGISLACTTFCLQKNGQILFGRNYDWISGAGIIHTNQRGLVKKSSDKSFEWVSKYGSITFNQYGKEFPTGGMNEKGLVVELMWLDGTKYPEPDKRPAIGVLRWIQYQLDNCASVKELISSDAKIRIEKDDTPLHYLVADASGQVATIEFLNGKMKVHTGTELPFPVLTNSTYQESKQIFETYSYHNLPPPADNSLERFIKACNMINQVEANNIPMPIHNYAFSILDHVSQGDYTQWSIVYDIVNKKIFFKTNDFKSVKSFSFNAFDFNCSTLPKMYNMNQAGVNDISNKFTGPDPATKKAVLEKAIRESIQQVPIDEAGKKFLLEYEQTITCKD